MPRLLCDIEPRETNLRAELSRVAERFEESLERVSSTDTTARGRPSRRRDRGINPENICVTLPFFLADGATFRGRLEAARTLSLANAFGATHFLIHDDVLDGDRTVDPGAQLLGDACHALFLRGLFGLFPDDSVIWRQLERFTGEYFASALWEADVLQSEAGGRAVEGDGLSRCMTMLGRKMSPLKTSAVGMLLLDGRFELAGAAERMIEEYHAGYQLADDLEDLSEDLRRGRWSTAAWMIANAAGLAAPPGPGECGAFCETAVTSGGLERVATEIADRYAAALDVARSLGSPSLIRFLTRALDDAVVGSAWAGRRARVLSAANGTSATGRAARGNGSRPAGVLAALHEFRVAGSCFIYDSTSGFFFEADSAAMDVLRWLRNGGGEVGYRVLAADHGEDAVEGALDDLDALAPERREPQCSIAGAAHGDAGGASPGAWPGGGCASTDPCDSGIVALALNVTEACNLACDYCYHRGAESSSVMDEATLLRAFDLLATESFGESRVSIIFFGGEPLLVPDLIERGVRAARERLGRERRIDFHVTTNGTLLTPDIAAMLHANDVRVLVSIDGDPSDHDARRPFANGSGSHRTIADNVSRLPDGMSVGARATVCEESSPMGVIAAHLRAMGFSVAHLAPVGGVSMSRAFAERLADEFELLAREELDAVSGGAAPFIGNIIEPVLSLDAGSPRRLPCGAGARYLCVGSDGTLYLCHRFAGDSARVVGGVDDGLDRSTLGALMGGLRKRMSACDSCWARALCGGPCYYDLVSGPAESVGTRAVRCGVRRRVFELAMWFYAGLPADRRDSMRKASRRCVRPELAAGDRNDKGEGR